MDPRSRTPPVPVALGIAGLVPFVGLATVLATNASGRLGWSPAFVHAALSTYAAVILSFLGGIRWGLAVAIAGPTLSRWEYVASVIPSLLAWATLALPGPWDLRALAFLILALGFLDQNLVRRGEAPEWFGWLRLGLSVVACTALLLAL